jgi:hypothetical protein
MVGIRIRNSCTAFAVLCTIGLASASPLSSQTLKISAQPTVVIGADGDTTAQFTAIGGLGRLSTGEIAVFNAVPVDIRLFSPTGKFVRRVARPGGGPGELGAVYWFGRSGDSLMTFDLVQARITVFDVPRSQVATIPFAPTKVPSRLVVSGALANGSWVVATTSFSRTHVDGPARDSTTIGIWRAGTDGMQPIGAFPNLAYFYKNVPTGLAMNLDALAAHTTFLTVGSELWVGVPEASSIAVYDATGKLARQVRVPFEPIRFDNAELRRVRDRRLAAAKRAADSALISAMFDGSARPLGTRPAFSRLVLGRDGRVWVESFRVDRASSAEYIALDRTGKVVARLTSPPGVRFWDIGPDYALGVRKDEDDVETVELFSIVR